MKTFIEFILSEEDNKKKKSLGKKIKDAATSSKWGNQGVVHARTLGPYGRYGPTRWRG